MSSLRTATASRRHGPAISNCSSGSPAKPPGADLFRSENTARQVRGRNPPSISEHSAGAFLLSEFLEKEAHDFRPPRLDATALVHGHCHHKALMKMDAQEKVLRNLGIDYQMPDSGCCGMAGAFGFEDRHYDISMKCGERVLLPKVRDASKNTLVIADGFSCREQIKSGTDRRGLHLAQVLKMAIDETPSSTNFPERKYIRQEGLYDAKPLLAAAAIVAGVSLALWGLLKSRDSDGDAHDRRTNTLPAH